MNKRDIVKVKINSDELEVIRKYCEKMFPAKKVAEYGYQWKSNSNRNPNETGIIGEWAYYKMYSKEKVTLRDYLKHRPSFRGDHGDGVLDSGSIVDIKTRYFDDVMENMWDKDCYTGRVEEKHIDKDFIDLFVFVHVHPIGEMAYIIGWMDRDDFFSKAKLIKNKGGVVRSGMPNVNWYQMHYSKLNSIDEIKKYKICEIEI